MAVAALFSDNFEPQGLDPRNLDAERPRASSGPSQKEASNSGRVRSSRVGFRIGPLGLSYTRRSLDLDSAELDRLARAFESLNAGPRQPSASFLTPTDLDHLNGFLDGNRETGRADAPVDQARRRGAEAYASVAAGRNEQRGRVLLSVV